MIQICSGIISGSVFNSFIHKDYRYILFRGLQRNLHETACKQMYDYDYDYEFI